MSYTVKGYARLILRHEHLLDGWPRHLHFADPSDIPGGAAPLLDLLDLWEKKILRFVKATPQDLENAARDPRSVHPNPERLSEWETEAAAAVESAQASGRSTQPTDIVSDVFHPDDLSLLGTHATSTKPAPGRHPRRQRSDTKRARFQPYTLGTTRRRSRRGMVSNPFVVSDSKDGRGAFRTTNEPIDEFKDVPTGDGSR